MQGPEQFIHLVDRCRRGEFEICDDSRKVRPGDVFVARSGVASDGQAYIREALERGASHIVCAAPWQEALAGQGSQAAWILVQDPQLALASLARARFATEDLPFKIIGITGTNGKTTCAWLLEYFFNKKGAKTGLLGTIEYHWPGFKMAAPLTTPGALELHGMLGQMKRAGVDAAIMEVSSHALAQERVAGIDFDGAIFTNLTQDHLDYHKDMESYFQAKAELFLRLPRLGKAMAINGDDPYGRRLLELAPQALAFGSRPGGRRHLLGRILEGGAQGMHLRMTLGNTSWELRTPMIGAYNAANLLAAQALALELGYAPEDLEVFSGFTGVPGRLERIPNPQGYHIFVDYAHTPDALINVLRALRGAGFKHIVTVFGCGGNRDREKRPLMGKAVAENSDIAILTSDNPRHEDPLAIMEDVRPGLAGAARMVWEPERRRATQAALELASRESAILIAGKGHEDYQIIGSLKTHYSDQEVIRELLGCA